MDPYVRAWGQRVKARGGRGAPPPLWLFTDTERRADPRPLVAGLPRGLCGVVLRHDAGPGGGHEAAARERLGRALARLCRERRLLLAVAGDWRLAARLGAGLHLRGGRLPGLAPRWLPRLTASAHDAIETERARRAGAALVFLSPLFPTASHPGGSVLGPSRWARLARRLPGRVAALGGIEGPRVRAVPRRSGAIGGIGAFEGR